MIRALLLAALPCAALAAPPPGADPERHAWFERQHSVAGAWCCNLSDGHLLSDSEWREIDGKYQVRIGGAWRDIPADAMRDPAGGPNITGHAVVWYVMGEAGLRIYCFAPGMMY